MKLKYMGLLLLFCIKMQTLEAQFSTYAKPLGTLDNTESLNRIPVIDLHTLSNDSLKRTYQYHACNLNERIYGITIPKPLNICESGKWKTLVNGNKILMLRFSSPSAKGFQFVFEKFHIPIGGKLLIYDLTKTHILGAFTHANNRNDARFITRPIYENDVILEYQANGAKLLPLLELTNLVYVFDTGDNRIDFGESADCQTNVNCVPWNQVEYCKEIRATVKIFINSCYALIFQNSHSRVILPL